MSGNYIENFEIQILPTEKVVKECEDDWKHIQSILFGTSLKFEQKYKKGSFIQKGGFGSVSAGMRIQDNYPVAIKQLLKSQILKWIKINGRQVPMEIYLLCKVSHIDGVIKILDYFEHENYYFIVMERPDQCVDLFDFTKEHGCLKEEVARKILKQVVRSVVHCAEAGVYHMDIKSENILVEKNTNRIKLIDFGSGAILKEGIYTDFYGTQIYAPPEWIQWRKYEGSPATVWSLGVLLFDTLFGKTPFETEVEIVKGHLTFPTLISEDCQNLIRRCLNVMVEERVKLEELVNDPWMNKEIETLDPVT